MCCDECVFWKSIIVCIYANIWIFFEIYGVIERNQQKWPTFEEKKTLKIGTCMMLVLKIIFMNMKDLVRFKGIDRSIYLFIYTLYRSNGCLHEHLKLFIFLSSFTVFIVQIEWTCFSSVRIGIDPSVLSRSLLLTPCSSCTVRTTHQHCVLLLFFLDICFCYWTLLYCVLVFLCWSRREHWDDRSSTDKLLQFFTLKNNKYHHQSFDEGEKKRRDKLKGKQKKKYEQTV